MKKSDLFFNVILVPLDYIMLLLSWILIYYLRFSALVKFRPVIYEIPLKNYIFATLLVSLAWLIIFIIAGLYDLKEKKHFIKEFSKIFLACSVGTMLTILAIFFRGELFSSRFIILASWPVSIILISIGRIIVHWFKLFYYKEGKGLEPILIYGNTQISREIVNRIKNNSKLGYKIIGEIYSIDELIKNWQNRTTEISQLILADSSVSREEKLKLAEYCNEHQIIFKYITDMFGALSTNIQADTLIGIPIIEVKRTALSDWGKIFKRIVDIILSIVSLIIFAPLFLIVAILIKLDSSGPCFVVLSRIGRRGKKFNLYKFRSMIKDANNLKKDLLKYNERKGPLFKMNEDPRITKFGRILRKTSIDELPQLVNVLKGEMSLVGPRPHEPEEVKKYKNSYKQLLTIKPGITGLAQVSGRSVLPFDEEVKLDIYYIENWSMAFDIKILLKTIIVVLSSKNVA